ncbi:MAG: hypothetical protein PHN89_00485 [Candidatus Pacebacteria bacterium]|nr:hypothetical protein [Candidatus Paceibacterota bacterium]
MKPKSIREKGKKAEKELCRRIERAGLGGSCRTPGSGSGKKKGDVFNNLPFMIEVKNEKQTNFLSNIDQAKRQAEQGNFDPNKWGLVTVDPRGVQDQERMTMYFTCELDEALELMTKSAAPKIKAPDKELKWLLETLRTSLQYLIRNSGDKYYYGRLKKVANEIIKMIK